MNILGKIFDDIAGPAPYDPAPDIETLSAAIERHDHAAVTTALAAIKDKAAFLANRRHEVSPYQEVLKTAIRSDDPAIFAAVLAFQEDMNLLVDDSYLAKAVRFSQWHDVRKTQLFYALQVGSRRVATQLAADPTKDFQHTEKNDGQWMNWVNEKSTRLTPLNFIKGKGMEDVESLLMQRTIPVIEADIRERQAAIDRMRDLIVAYDRVTAIKNPPAAAPSGLDAI